MKKLLQICTSLLLFFVVFFSPQGVNAAQTGTLLPQSDGTYLEWNPKSGATHYAMVDETTCNGNTDFVRTTVVNERDSYGLNISSVPNGSTITQIDITPCASKNTNGGSNSTASVFYRLNNVNSNDSAGYSLSGTTPSELSSTAFTSLSVVKSSSTTLESGMVFTAGTKGAKLGRIATIVTYTPLWAPTSLTATAASQTQIDLSWTDNASNEDGFRVDRSPNGTSPWIEVGTTATDDTTFSDTGLTANTTYYYRVYAYNSGGNSGFSNTASSKTLFNAPTVTTNNAFSITASTASLAATINPNGGSTTRHYRYGDAETDCVSLPNSTSSVGIGSGTSNVSPNAQQLFGLITQTTYYFCAVATNTSGTTYGSVLSFTTL